MATKKSNTRKTTLANPILILATKNPYEKFKDSALSDLWEKLHKRQRTIRELTLTVDGAVGLAMFHMALDIVCNPLNPANNWSSVVEKLAFGDDVYLRLVPELPIAVVDFWKEHGHPPPTGWRFFDGGGATSGSLPQGGRPPAAANPYDPERKNGKIFEMARDWVDRDKLLHRITVELSGGNAVNAWSLWNLVAVPNPKKNSGRTRAEERTVGDVRQVRLVLNKP